MTTRQPKPTHLAERVVENNRLAYYLEAADANFWDTQWRQYLTSDSYILYEQQGYLGNMAESIIKYMPKDGKILEAGCGPAWYVAALRSLGYDAEGVDFAPETIEKVLQCRPDLPVYLGDVTKLDVPDNFYAGYISLGVAEHRKEGPEPFLQEAYRVLRPGGIALISVPYFHALRQFKSRRNMYRGKIEGLSFYQYAFLKNEFVRLVQDTGFSIREVFAYNARKGIKDEITFIRNHLEKRTWIGRYFEILADKSSYLHRHFGHMLVVVAQR